MAVAEGRAAAGDVGGGVVDDPRGELLGDRGVDQEAGVVGGWGQKRPIQPLRVMDGLPGDHRRPRGQLTPVIHTADFGD
ncbi:hypothetical protein [Streptomyces sp. NPDC048496]|uniref:hypothetical protein n=1 Tax=Streptomyces sp. NPDC048496 TaxID=3365558 RepID=UPI00371C1BF9